MPAKTTDAGDINAIMGDGGASASSSGGTKAATGYDIWYLLKALLVMIVIVGVFDYFMNRKKIISESENKPKKK
jgi:hypothetical protein